MREMENKVNNSRFNKWQGKQSHKRIQTIPGFHRIKGPDSHGQFIIED